MLLRCLRHRRWAGLTMLVLGCLAAGCARQAVDPRAHAWRLAVPVPQAGPLATSGADMLDGVRLAVADEAPRLTRLGIAIEVVPYDDSHVRAAVANAEIICADGRTIAVIGHFDSAAAIPASERYHQCGLVYLAPTSTAPELTERGLENVNRLLLPDDDQGRLAAEFAARRLQARRALVIHDGTVYGQGLADAFKREAEALGLRVMGYVGVSRGRLSLGPLTAQVAASGVDVVFFGGIYPEGRLILAAIRSAGITTPLLGGDGLDVPQLRDERGGKGVYHTSFSLGLATPAARRWTAHFQEAFGRRPGPLAAYSYDAARFTLAAMEAEVARLHRPPTRSELAAAVRRASEYDGVSLSIAFDDRGDNILAKRAFGLRFCDDSACRPIDGERHPAAR